MVVDISRRLSAAAGMGVGGCSLGLSVGCASDAVIAAAERNLLVLVVGLLPGTAAARLAMVSHHCVFLYKMPTLVLY